MLSSARTRAELPSTACAARADSGARGLVRGSFSYWVCSLPVPCLALYHSRVTLAGSILAVLLWPSSVSRKHWAGEQGTSRGQAGWAAVTAPEGITVALTPLLPLRPAGSPVRPLVPPTALPSPPVLPPVSLQALAGLLDPRVASEFIPCLAKPLALNSLSPALRVASVLLIGPWLTLGLTALSHS